jgi:hypothetical protein
MAVNIYLLSLNRSSFVPKSHFSLGPGFGRMGASAIQDAKFPLCANEHFPAGILEMAMHSSGLQFASTKIALCGGSRPFPHEADPRRKKCRAQP